MSDYQPGDVLDDFKITKVLFSGASASLYEAVDGLSGETVVLKVPFGDILNKPFLFYHYQNEERITRTLHHPRIARYFLRDRSLQYIIMEYLPGRDLKSILYREKKLSWNRARPLMIQVCEGLAYLHGQGIIHHDIKPENIVVTADHAVKLVDFGLASKAGIQDLIALDLEGPHGTPYYIAPEELQGARNDPRSDLYSLGVVLYETLTANLPFERSTRMSKVRDRLKIDPVPPRYYDESLAPSVQEIILKALERKADARYETAAAMMEAFLHAEGLPPTARGRLTRKPVLWTRQKAKLQAAESISRREKILEGRAPGTKPAIVGTILDHDVSDLVVETVRRKALLLGGEVTLLTLLEEEGDPEMTRYQTAVEGERFRKRIENYVNRFRRYGLDPTVRIVKGDAPEGIVTIARELKAVLIVLGPTRRKKWHKLFGGQIADRVMRKAPCTVIVAEAKPGAAIPTGEDITHLTPDILVDIDLFLIDVWVQHVNWLAELAHRLLKDPRSPVDLDDQNCPIGGWLSQMTGTVIGHEIQAMVGEPHHAFHAVANEMASRARADDRKGMQRIYMEKALPLSCEIKERLKRVSTYLRERAAFKEAGLVPFLQDDRCPLTEEQLPSGGPMLKVMAIRRYFKEHPDGSPRACLSAIEGGEAEGTSTGRSA